MTTLYVTRAELKDYASGIAQSNTSIDTILDQKIASASRWVDGYTGRRFYKDVDGAGAPVLTARLYRPCEQYVFTEDIANTATAVVAVAYTTDGVYDATWTANTDFLFEPLNGVVEGIPGWPADRLQVIAGSTGQYGSWPSYRSSLPTVRVTAQWGWPAVPDAVKEATYIVALNLLKRKDAPFDVAGFDGFGAVRVGATSKSVAELLDRYCA